MCVCVCVCVCKENKRKADARLRELAPNARGSLESRNLAFTFYFVLYVYVTLYALTIMKYFQA